jgi:hypothetical protein
MVLAMQVVVVLQELLKIKVFHQVVKLVQVQQQERQREFLVVAVSFVVVVGLVVHQVVTQVVLVVQAISMQAVLAHQEQVYLLVAVGAEQVLLLLAQMHLLTMVVMGVQAVEVEERLLLVVLLAQAVTALFIFTTKKRK